MIRANPKMPQAMTLRWVRNRAARLPRESGASGNPGQHGIQRQPVPDEAPAPTAQIAHAGAEQCRGDPDEQIIGGVGNAEKYGVDDQGQPEDAPGDDLALGQEPGSAR